MSKRKKLVVIAVAIACVVVVAGATSAAAGLEDDEPGATTLTTGSVPTTLPVAADFAEPSAATNTTLQPFGQTISALRHAGDHTPAAVIKGKEVPGWDPAKHAGQDKAGAAENDGDIDETDVDDESSTELGPDESNGNSGKKDHVPAAVLMGKKVPGQSKK